MEKKKFNIIFIFEDVLPLLLNTHDDSGEAAVVSNDEIPPNVKSRGGASNLKYGVLTNDSRSEE